MAELLIKSYDDPTLFYGVKDEETFYRVYGHESRFYIANASAAEYIASVTPAPVVDESSEFEDRGEKLEDTPSADVAPVSEPGSPEF